MSSTHGKRPKKEPVDVKPLSEYVDDRLELIKQCFKCLKPKTIKDITPKCLRNDDLETIQEKCLDEILGISKKRLLSIINDTNCPTDTESSDDDIQEVLEHISLDEISSDDDRKAPRKKSAAKSNGTSTRKRTGEAKDDPKKPPEEPKKEYSVLELLELQARARAIRSQLALEPVTKIELDDDDDDDEEEEEGEKTAEKKKPKEATPKDPPTIDDQRASERRRLDKLEERLRKAQSITKPPPNEEPPKASSSKSPEKVKSTKSPEKSKRVSTPELQAGDLRWKLKRNYRKNSPQPEKKQKSKEESDSKSKRDKETTRESSPEVMPIVPSPVTLCISSSDEEGESPNKGTNVIPAEIKNVPVKIAVEDPPEEGEIAEEEEENGADETSEAKLDKDEKEEEKVAVPPKDEETHQTEPIIEDPPKEDDDVLCVQLDDDCIDLECDDPIEDEELEREGQTSKGEEAVVVADSSGDECVPEKEKEKDDSASNDSRSWNERWLESSKVTKILATSKLGNQVRRKIQLSKKTEKLQQALSAETEKPPVDSPATPVEGSETGTIEHYRKLLAAEASKQQ